MSLSQLCTTYVSSTKLKDENERNIIEFAEAPWGLGLGSTPGVPGLMPVQKFIFKSYYNIPLSNKSDERKIIIKDKFNEKERYRFNEVEYLHFLYEEGRINIKEVTGDKKDKRENLALVIGRRGLKTSTIAVLVAFETYKLLKKISPQEYYGIMPDDEIWFTCLATDKEQASELFRRICGHLERSDYFKKYRNEPTQFYMLLNTQRDIEKYGHNRPSIRINAAACSARGIRSHNNAIVILDEMAHFFESESNSNKSDTAVYEAATPSVAKFNTPEGEPDGRVIGISSPNDKTGKFFKIYQRSFEPTCTDWLMIQAPTWEVDYTLSPKFLRNKYIENPISYMSEYGAEFSDRVTAWLDNPQILRVNIIPGLKLKKLSYEQIPHFMGIDVGLKTDGSAIAISHIVKREIDGIVKNIIELDSIAVRYAKDENREYFQPEEIAEWIISFAEKFYIVSGFMDQYYGMAIIPILHEKGLKQIKAIDVSRNLNSRIYQNLMSKMLDNSLRIPVGEERIVDKKKTDDLTLVSELLTLKATKHSKYLISVEAPDVKGYHDDESDAYARSVWEATQFLQHGSNILGKHSKVNSDKGMKTYKQYHRKQKRNVIHTKRPSSSIQMEVARNSFGTGLSNRWR